MRITLLRHSIAETPGSDDFNRGLTQEGIEKASTLAIKLLDSGITEIICSPALRTVQTAKPIAEALKINLVYEPGLYNASFAKIKEVFDEVSDDDHRMIVGHNPGISQLATLLDRSLYRSFEPCQGATFECVKNSWLLVEKWL
jgi:phosphohistidine phosphatase SixA